MGMNASMHSAPLMNSVHRRVGKRSATHQNLVGGAALTHPTNLRAPQRLPGLSTPTGVIDDSATKLPTVVMSPPGWLAVHIAKR
jgi:hypothetical protein